MSPLTLATCITVILLSLVLLTSGLTSLYKTCRGY